MKRLFKVVSVYAILKTLAPDQHIVVRDHQDLHPSWGVVKMPYQTLYDGLKSKFPYPNKHHVMRATVFALSTENNNLIMDISMANEEF